jgi:DNA-binding transcriptional MerR regulator
MTGALPAQPAYGIGALARRLGIAPATLRDWERRYGIAPGGRTAGGHRRYRPADVARIEHMRRMILDGVPPAEAARAALAADPATPAAAEVPAGIAAGSDPAAPAPAEVPAGIPAGSALAADPAAPAPAEVPAGIAAGSALAPGGPPAWGAGGRSLALPGRPPLARGLARAALALDGPAISRTLDSSLREHGVVATWEHLAIPVLASIGERHAATGDLVDVEHLLSGQLLAALAQRASQVSAPRSSRTVLLACADGEQHSLALYALAAALAERGVRTLMLGARTPPDALADAISRTGPAAAMIWSQTADTGDPAQLAGIPRQRPPLRLFAAGPGWRAAPPGGRLVSSLAEAVREARAAVGAA